jgi:sulfate permease, SulP family
VRTAFPAPSRLACPLESIPPRGRYAYLSGTIGGSLFTSSVFMAVQATGAMTVVIAGVPAVHAVQGAGIPG